MTWRRPHADEPKDQGEPVADRDPVADFFAARRQDVRAEEADEVTWARIAREARAGRRRGRDGHAWLGSLGACAAVLLAVFAIWSWQQQPIDDATVHAGRTLSQEPAVAAPGDGPAVRRATPVQRPGPVPSGFVTWSLSNAGNGTVYALGSTTCDGSICPTLLRSADDGGTWSAVQTFSDTDVSSLTGADVPAVQPNRGVGEVRFANQQVGYAYGGDLWATTDRGASFHSAQHPGETVLDLEIWAERVYLLTADNCVQGACAGPIHLSTASASAPDRFTAVASLNLARPIEDASLTVSGSRAAGHDIVLVQTQGQNRVTEQPFRLAGRSLQPVTGPSARCGNTPLAALTITADAANRVIGLCRKDAGVPTYAVVTSSDGGRSWTSVEGSAVTLPDAGRLSVAATDVNHIAVSAGGPRGSSGLSAAQAVRALQMSADGGRTFTVPKVPNPPSGGFDWTASPGGGWFYAVSHTTGGFWSSRDNGRTWKVTSPSS